MNQLTGMLKEIYSRSTMADKEQNELVEKIEGIHKCKENEKESLTKENTNQIDNVRKQNIVCKISNLVCNCC